MEDTVTVVIDRSKDEPAYEQIARQIRAHIANGGLTAGTTLPGVRTLAADLGVNLNTVARAYRLLADQGFVSIRDRSGVAVAAPARSPAPDANAIFQAELDTLLARMRQAGVPTDDVRRMVDHKLDRLSNPRKESEN
jgi:DNA-binding transcriptional regulator YhcF (GntR family)